MPIILDQNDRPVEIAPGRGDLRRSSVAFDPFMYGGMNSPFVEGRPVSYAKIFATQPWVGIAVMRLLSWSVRVPLKVFKRVSDDEVRRLYPKDHPLAAAVARPWERASMAQLTTHLLGPLLVHGNALLEVDQGARNKIQFETLDWRTVKPIALDEQDPNSEIVGWKVGSPTVAGRTRDRSADRVMHLRWWSPLGQEGISPLEMIRTTVLSEEAAVRWTINNLNQAARPSGVVEADESFLGLERTERAQLLEQTREDLSRYAGPEGAGRLPVLPPGLKWSSAPQVTAVEAELIDQRFVNRNEVAAVYMLPPSMIGQLDKATFSNISTQREMGYTDGLAPPLILAEQQINAHVCWGLLREDDLFVQYDFGHLLRGDRLKEIQAYREGVHSGIYAPDEARENLGMKKRGGQAGELHLPLNNLKPITGSGATAPEEEEVNT